VPNKETKIEVNKINSSQELQQLPELNLSSSCILNNDNNISTKLKNNVDESTTLRKRNDQSKNERITNLVEKMRSKQIEHENDQKNNKVKYNRFKPYLVGGGMLLAGVLFMKLYRNYVGNV
jgi:hypothetical protein